MTAALAALLSPEAIGVLIFLTVGVLIGALVLVSRHLGISAAALKDSRALAEQEAAAIRRQAAMERAEADAPHTEADLNKRLEDGSA